ncbi:glycosyl hydrolase family 43, partial [Bifidobacterium longum]|nr:glycosyl hydrolase family 43 [Bifidobacterium longum]
MSFHVSAQSVRAVAGGLVAAATLLSGLALAPTAMAADSATADNAPSVAGHAYNELPYNNPDVTVTQIDNSALPSYMRNPIGQNEGIDTPNDLSQNYYSADASALSYDGKLFVFTGHDEASPDYGSFNMKDWGVYVTDEDGLNQGKWTHYKTIAKADLFSWATGDGAYAGQVVADDN